MGEPVRYLGITYLRSGKGLAPLILLLLIFLLIWQTHLSALDVHQFVCIIAAPYTAWVTFACLDAEHPTQEQVTAAATGGLRRWRLLKTGFGAALAGLILMALLAPTAVALPTAQGVAVEMVAMIFVVTGACLAALLDAAAGHRVGWRMAGVVGFLCLAVRGGGVSPWAQLLHTAGSGDTLSLVLWSAVIVAIMTAGLPWASRRWNRRG